MLTSIASERRLLRGLRQIHRWLAVIFVVLFLAVILKLFVVTPVKVEGRSMEPTILNNQYVWIDQITYLFKDPVVGEVVMVQTGSSPHIRFVSRVYALPGTVLEINGQQLSLTDEYFLVGDNFDMTTNPKFSGVVSKNEILGKVLGRFGQVISPLSLP